MRRGVGVSAVIKKKDESAQFKAAGKVIEETKLSSVKDTLEKFNASLSEFAEKHRNKINSDPEFRHQFHTMCVSVGVDPLSSNKGFWADVLGVGEFYFELGVIIIQICLQTRSENGGIISLNVLLDRVREYRKRQRKAQVVSMEDLKRSVEKLAVLGSGFKLVEFRGASKETFVVSVPMELSRDHEDLMNMAQEYGFFSLGMMKSTGWTPERFSRATHTLLQDGMVWVDVHDGMSTFHLIYIFVTFNLFIRIMYLILLGEHDFYFPSIWKSNKEMV